MATKTIHSLGTAISPEYVKDWTLEMGVRELLQNALDTKKQFKCRTSVVSKNGYAQIIDDGPGLEIKHLALGVSEKSGDAIGQFGEGLKLALLLFAREGLRIEVRSKDYKLIPAIRIGDYQTETLFFDVEEGLDSVTGTRIKFECTPEQLDEAKCYFPTEFKCSDKVKWVIKDKVSLPAGRIFVNGSIVSTLDDAMFSYHLTGEEAKKLSNRDRTIVDANGARAAIKNMLFYNEIEQHEVAGYKAWFSVVFQGFKDKNENFYERRLYPFYSCGNVLSSAMTKAWNFVFGKNTLINNDAPPNIVALALRMGMPSINMNWDWNYIIQNSCKIETVVQFMRQRPMDDKIKVVSALQPHEEANLDFAIDLVSKMYHEPQNVIVVQELDTYAGIIQESALSEENHVQGIYQDGKIYIIRRVLNSKLDALKIILHETVHQHTNAVDLSAEFQAEYDVIAAKFLYAAAN